MSKRPTAVDRLMAEVIAYGGFAMTRGAVYQDMIQQGFPAIGGFGSADYFAFHGPALTPEQIAGLIPADRFKEVTR